MSGYSFYFVDSGCLFTHSQFARLISAMPILFLMAIAMSEHSMVSGMRRNPDLMKLIRNGCKREPARIHPKGHKTMTLAKNTTLQK